MFAADPVLGLQATMTSNTIMTSTKSGPEGSIAQSQRPWGH